MIERTVEINTFYTVLRSFVRMNRATSEYLQETWPSIFSGGDYVEVFKEEIERNILETEPSSILEVGGTDRPIISRATNYQFVGLDIDRRPDCAHLYDKFLVQSIEQPVPISVDMLVSITLLEHVSNNSASVKSMYGALTDDGKTLHYVPSGFHPYSICLRLLGPRLQRRLIPILRPGTENVTGYPTFFDHCTPRAMRRLFEETGFEEVRVELFYRANDYFAFFTPAYILISVFENICHRLGFTMFASGFIITARKPRSSKVD